NLYAWCVLPNHYHLLLQTDRLKELRADLENFTAVRHSNGMGKTILADDKFGTIAWIEVLNHTGIFGRALTTFITIQCITAMLRNGMIGCGPALPISLNASGERLPQRFGASTQFSIMVRGGTLTHGVRVPTLVGYFLRDEKARLKSVL
ncbi:MAG TPA: hypothetical protein VLN44_12020, partial [Pyrinomonadaceae bacterium]|nr:hypothetical protein [Pyrinomonadaceae bacterium]